MTTKTLTKHTHGGKRPGTGGPREGAGRPKGPALILISARVAPEIQERLTKEAQDRGVYPSALLAQIVTERYKTTETEPAEK